MPSSARSAARSAQSAPAFQFLARAGFVANGLVHLLLSVLVLAVALGGDEQADQGGALQTLAGAPFGVVALWACAVALWALGLWRAITAFTAHGDRGDRSKGGQAIAYIVVGGIAATVALGGRSQGDQSAENTSAGILALPGGPLILGLCGAVVVGIGVGFVVMGARRSFRKRVSTPRGQAGRAFVALGVVGYIAKGVALATVGVLLLVAAVTLDASAAGGLNGAVTALLAAPAGPWLAGAVGVGFIAYGVFTVIRARYARLDQ
jgi:hypothetical protein